MLSTTTRDGIGDVLAGIDDPGDPATVADCLRAIVALEPDVPLPGSGRTWDRFAFLARVAAASPALARLVEGHHDALAILAELHVTAPYPSRLGVWAAEPAGTFVRAVPARGGWTLRGEKPYASGAATLTHALVTARHGDARLLFLLPASAWRALPGTWQAIGMEGSDSPTVIVDAVVDDVALVAGPGAYLARPGFWHGGAGVAAAWHGGAVGVAAALRQAAARREPSPHVAAHLGGVEVALHASASVLQEAAEAIDADPLDLGGDAERRARITRAVVERTGAEVLDRVGRALGATPLCHDRAHARRVTDLTVYLRQSHGEGDLEALGRIVAGEGPA